MIYKNYTDEAIFELERQRTMNYYDDCDDNSSECECAECKTVRGTFYEINSVTYCSDCVCELLREGYETILSEFPDDRVTSGKILEDIIADFSDSELLCYVENKYKKIDA